MKTVVLSILFLSFGLIGMTQTKTDLEEKNRQLTAENKILSDQNQQLTQQLIDLKAEILNCKSENQRLQSSAGNLNNATTLVGLVQDSNVADKSTKRCKAITAKGTQCTRTAEAGSDYCWQHKSTYEPTSTANNKSSVSSSSSSSRSSGTSTSSGRTIMTGPRGGKYYINKNGNKTYIKK